MLPGLGWFRAPARYTLLTSLGLSLLAGCGLDRSITPARFRVGLIVALVIGAASWVWSVAWIRDPLFQASFGSEHAVAAIWDCGTVLVPEPDLTSLPGTGPCWHLGSTRRSDGRALLRSSILGQSRGDGRPAFPGRVRFSSGSLASRRPG